MVDHSVGTVTLVLGGTRSGKSEFAERLVEQYPSPHLYIATGTATDADMGARIDAHRARRGATYETIEAGPNLVAALAAAPEHAAIVDSLGTWVAAHEDFEVDARALADALAARRAPTVVVSDEVGLGVHPSTEVGRWFRDALGLTNQIVAARASTVWLVVAGRGLRLEEP